MAAVAPASKPDSRTAMQKKGVQKDGAQSKDVTVLLGRLLAKDQEIARALKSIR